MATIEPRVRQETSNLPTYSPPHTNTASRNHYPFQRVAQGNPRARNQTCFQNPSQQQNPQQNQRPIANTNPRSNPRLTNPLYTGMTFCPGIDKIPVARFLPPQEGLYNMMELHGKGPALLAKCAHCGQDLVYHLQGQSWYECTNNCWCHDQPPHNNLFCPGLYSTIPKLNRIFHWPNNVELPAYLRIFPTNEQQKHLLAAGYIEGPVDTIEIPTFTQKAWALEPELRIVTQSRLGEPGYDFNVLKTRTLADKVPKTHGVKRSHESVFDNTETQSQLPPNFRPDPHGTAFNTQATPAYLRNKIVAQNRTASNFIDLTGPSSRANSDIALNTPLRFEGETSDEPGLPISRKQRTLYNQAVRENNPDALLKELQAVSTKLKKAENENLILKNENIILREELKKLGSDPPRPLQTPRAGQVPLAT